MIMDDSCFCAWDEIPTPDAWLPYATPEFAAKRKIEREAMLNKKKES
jgi:hypothetical protein